MIQGLLFVASFLCAVLISYVSVTLMLWACWLIWIWWDGVPDIPNTQLFIRGLKIADVVNQVPAYVEHACYKKVTVENGIVRHRYQLKSDSAWFNTQSLYRFILSDNAVIHVRYPR